MKSVTAFYQSSIGKKIIVALTALVLLGFVFGHLIGNLQMFAGQQPVTVKGVEMMAAQDKINTYAEFLQNLGPLLWAIRLFLVAVFVIHIVATLKLVIENRIARAQRYECKASVQAKAATRTMAISGLIVLSFVIYHLLHFTTNTTNPDFATLEDPLNRHDVYTMVIHGFQNKFAGAFYLLGVGLLCMHMSHGIASLFQTLGVVSEKHFPLLQHGSRALSALVFLGYASIPTAVWFEYLKLPQ